MEKGIVKINIYITGSHVDQERQDYAYGRENDKQDAGLGSVESE